MPIDFARAFRRVTSIAFLGLVLGACSEPLQNGGVIVFGGASARFDAMCRFRRGSDGQQSSCGPGAPDVSRATALRIGSESQLLKGSRAEGSVGDVLLTNGEISVVFGGPESARPGVLLDIVDTHVGQDELGSLMSCVADGGDCLPLAPPEFGQEHDGSAWVEVHLSGRKSFDARTRYTLIPGARSLLITTNVSTQSTEPSSLSRVGDVVAWGSSRPTTPSGEAPPFVAAIGTDVAYAIMPVDDRSTVAMEGAMEGAMFVRHARDVAVSAGHPIRRDRAFVVAPRGDTLGVLTEVSLMRDGHAPGAIEVRFVGADGSPLVPPAGGHIRVLTPSFPIDGYLAIGSSPDGSTVAAEAPPGKYELDFDGTGRRATGKVAVEVRSGEVTQATMVLENDTTPRAP
jgi:hypothetical protein